jgi:hypothetical protein
MPFFDALLCYFCFCEFVSLLTFLSALYLCISHLRWRGIRSFRTGGAQVSCLTFLFRSDTPLSYHRHYTPGVYFRSLRYLVGPVFSVSHRTYLLSNLRFFIFLVRGPVLVAIRGIAIFLLRAFVVVLFMSTPSWKPLTLRCAC